MRLQRKNKKWITYSLFDHVEPIYKRDINGNVVTEVIDGDQVPIEVGEQDVYTVPERKLVSFSTGGKSAIKDEYGIDDTDWNAPIMALLILALLNSSCEPSLLITIMINFGITLSFFSP